MIFITGDIHGNNDINKLSSNCFIKGNTLTREDYLIICGDFGLCWDESAEEKYWLKWLDRKPWTTLWIDGNHENFDNLKKYPLSEWNGIEVRKLTQNIIYIPRGSYFNLENYSFYAFGGAESHDKEFRELGKSIWNEELPNDEEIKKGRSELEKHDWKTDIIITHSFPTSIQEKFFQKNTYGVNSLTDFYDEIEKKCSFKLWFSGHYHHSLKYDDKHYFIFNNIIQLKENGFERVYPESSRASKREVLPEVFSME